MENFFKKSKTDYLNENEWEKVVEFGITHLIDSLGTEFTKNDLEVGVAIKDKFFVLTPNEIEERLIAIAEQD